MGELTKIQIALVSFFWVFISVVSIFETIPFWVANIYLLVGVGTIWGIYRHDAP
jgi:hypothetical protein